MSGLDHAVMVNLEWLCLKENVHKSTDQNQRHCKWVLTSTMRIDCQQHSHRLADGRLWRLAIDMFIRAGKIYIFWPNAFFEIQMRWVWIVLRLCNCHRLCCVGLCISHTISKVLAIFGKVEGSHIDAAAVAKIDGGGKREWIRFFFKCVTCSPCLKGKCTHTQRVSDHKSKIL